MGEGRARPRPSPPPLRKSDYLQDAHAAIEPDCQHVANLHAVSRRLFAHAIDADMTGLDQRRGAGARLHHPRVPQPFIETLALQATPIKHFVWTRFPYANRYPLQLKTR